MTSAQALVVVDDADACRIRDDGFLTGDEPEGDLVATRFEVRSEVEFEVPYRTATEHGQIVRVDASARDAYDFPGPYGACGRGSNRLLLLDINHDAGSVTVRVRVLLVPVALVPLIAGEVRLTASPAKRAAWKDAIEAAWSNHFDLVRAWGPAPSERYRILVEVEWVEADADRDYRVRLVTGDGRASTTRWFLNDPDIIAAHEFGHMLGNVDEYDGTDDGCPNRPVRDGIMNDEFEWPLPFPRHYWFIQRHVGAALCRGFDVEYSQDWRVRGGGL